MKNNRPLGWTTLKEAKMLVDAGLDPNTADMRYEEDNYESLDEWVAYPFGGDIKNFDVLKKEFPDSEFYPCWSLGALKNIVEEEFGKDFSYENSEWVIIVWSDLSGYKHYYFEEIANCVLWLLENGYIKKSE